MRTANHFSIPAAKQRGFTLLELLIASVIFAIMAIMAYGGLANVIDNSKASQTALKRLQQVQQSVSVLNRDFLQLVPRAVRDDYGNKKPAISAGNNIDYLIEFTRGGRVNPANLLRSTLLRVAYRFDDEKLIRLQWPKLDIAPGTEARETILIDNIEDVRIRFLDQKGQWLEQWPPLNSGNATNTTGANNPGLNSNAGSSGSATVLTAIEIVLQLNDWGEIRRLYAMD